MERIHQTSVISGDRGSVPAQALYDTGASLSFIRRDLADKVGVPVRLPRPMRFEMGRVGEYLEVHDQIALTFAVSDIPLLDSFLVADDLSEEAIVGARTMQKWGLQLDPEHERVIVDPKVARLKFVAFR
jgi:predicted aspartyl protease